MKNQHQKSNKIAKQKKTPKFAFASMKPKPTKRGYLSLAWSLPFLLLIRFSATSLPRIWNLDFGDQISLNLAEAGPELIQSATLTKQNPAVAIQSVQYVAQSNQATFSPSSFKMGSKLSKVSTSRLIQHQKDIYHLIMLIYDYAVAIFEIDTSSSSLVPRVSKLFYNFFGGRDVTAIPGFAKIGTSCHHISSKEPLGVILITCLETFKATASGSQTQILPFYISLEWTEKDNQYSNSQFYSQGMAVPQDSLYLAKSFIFGLGAAKKITTLDYQKLGILSVLNVLEGPSKLVIDSKLCYAAVQTDGYRKVSFVVSGQKEVNCVSLSSDYWKNGGGISGFSQQNSDLFGYDLGGENHIGIAESAGIGDTHSSYTLKSNVFIKSTQFVNFGTETSQDHKAVIVSINYSPDPKTPNKITLCVMELAALKLNPPKCDKVAFATFGKNIPVQHWITSSSLAFKRAGDNGLYLILGNQNYFVIFSVDLENQSMKQAHLNPTSNQQNGASYPVIQDEGDYLFVRFKELTGDNALRPQRYCFIMKKDFEMVCQGNYYNSIYSVFAADFGVVGKIAESLVVVPAAPKPRFTLKIEASDMLLKNVPFSTKVDMKGQTAEMEAPVTVYHNKSSFFEDKHWNFTVIKGSTIALDFLPGEVQGKFTRLSLPTLDIEDNRLTIRGIQVTQKDESKLEIDEGLKVERIFNLGALGYFAVWTTNATNNYSNNTLILVTCSFSFEKKLSNCQELDSLRVPEFAIFRQIRLFSQNLLSVNYFIKSTAYGSGVATTTKVLSLPFNTNSSTTTNPIQSLPTKFDETKNPLIRLMLKSNSSLSSSWINSVIQAELPTDKSHRGIYHTTLAFSSNLPGYTLGLNTASMKLSIETLVNEMEVVENSNGDRYLWMSLMDTGGETHPSRLDYIFLRRLRISEQTNQLEFDFTTDPLQGLKLSGAQLKLASVCPLSGQLFVYSRYTHWGISKPFFVSFDQKTLNSVSYLNISDSMIIVQSQCFMKINLVQMIMKDPVAKKSYFVNYQADLREFRERYHSRMEIPYQTTGFSSYLNDDESVVQTILITQKKSIKTSQIVLTRLGGLQLMFNSSLLTALNNTIPIKSLDGFGQENSAKIQVNVIPEVKEAIEVNLSTLVSPSTGKPLAVIQPNTTIDLDAILDINGTVLNLVLNSTLKDYKEGVDYEFKGRKYEVSSTSVGSLLFPTLKQSSWLSESLMPTEIERNSSQRDSKVLLSNHRIRVLDQPKLSLFGLREAVDPKKQMALYNRIKNLQVQRMKVVANWLVLQLQEPNQPAYIKMGYKPHLGAQRTKQIRGK